MIGIFITARMRSSRVPNKMLRLLNNQPVINYAIDIAKKAERLIPDSKAILCTSDSEEDFVLLPTALNKGIFCYRGSEEDKIKRYRDCMKSFGCEFAINIDGDDPFTSIYFIEQCYSIYMDSKKQLDFIYANDDMIIGAFTHGFSLKALNKICKIKKTDKTEMIRPYFIESGLFRWISFSLDGYFDFNKKWRFTLDYEEDFNFFETIIGNGCDTIQATLAYYPEHHRINSFRNKDFMKKQKETSKLCL